MQKKIFSNRNIIILIVVLFFLWLMFFDRNNLLRLQSVESQIEEMASECERYENLIREDSLIIEGLKDSAFVERYARENYYLHSPHETLYIIRDSAAQ